MSDFREDLRGFQDQMAEINKAALTDKADFDLAKCMRDGGRCLAGDRPARVVCTDVKCEFPGSILALIDYGSYEKVELCNAEGHNADIGLRNLPEYKEVEVTLWVSGDDCPASFYNVERLTFFGDQPHGPPGANWQPYGPPVKVRFER